MDKISVIVPIYNVEQYLRMCLDSIINQTYRNLEIILVDDGSPDNCGAICDEYAEKDGRIIVIHKENGGLSSARNAGLNICKGDYISFIDSDDFVSPYFLEVLYRGIELYSSEISSLSRCLDWFTDGQEKEIHLAETSDDYKISKCTPYEAIRLVMYQRIPSGVLTGLYKKEIFDDIRFPIGWLHEDAATIHRAFMNAKQMTLIDAHLYAYRLRSNSIMREKFSQKKLITITIAKQLIDDVCSYDVRLKDAAYSRALSLTYHTFLEIPLDDKESLTMVWASIKKYRSVVLHDKSPDVRWKDRMGAMISYLGMKTSWRIGRVLRDKRSGTIRLTT